MLRRRVRSPTAPLEAACGLMSLLSAETFHPRNIADGCGKRLVTRRTKQHPARGAANYGLAA